MFENFRFIDDFYLKLCHRNNVDEEWEETLTDGKHSCTLYNVDHSEMPIGGFSILVYYNECDMRYSNVNRFMNCVFATNKNLGDARIDSISAPHLRSGIKFPPDANFDCSYLYKL